MTSETLIEQRLAAVEAAIAEIQHRLDRDEPVQPENWVERFRGSFKDDPFFAEIVAYGQAIRAADRPCVGDSF